MKMVEARPCQVGSCGREAKLQLTVELSKLLHLQMNQVKDILREVIKCVNKPQCPVVDDWHERLNCDLMTVTRSVNQKGRKRRNVKVELMSRSNCS